MSSVIWWWNPINRRWVRDRWQRKTSLSCLPEEPIFNLPKVGELTFELSNCTGVNQYPEFLEALKEQLSNCTQRNQSPI